MFHVKHPGTARNTRTECSRARAARPVPGLAQPGPCASTFKPTPPAPRGHPPAPHVPVRPRRSFWSSTCSPVNLAITGLQRSTAEISPSSPNHRRDPAPIRRGPGAHHQTWTTGRIVLTLAAASAGPPAARRSSGSNRCGSAELGRSDRKGHAARVHVDAPAPERICSHRRSHARSDVPRETPGPEMRPHQRGRCPGLPTRRGQRSSDVCNFFSITKDA